MVEGRELRRLITDPDLKPVESLVHVYVVGVLPRRLYVGVFRPRRIASSLHNGTSQTRHSFFFFWFLSTILMVQVEQSVQYACFCNVT